jgi:hypothetical protein
MSILCLYFADFEYWNFSISISVAVVFWLTTPVNIVDRQQVNVK